MQRVWPNQTYRLFSVAQTRALEQGTLAHLPPHTLMQRAGLAVANLACALAPHARKVWIACGPGNNGGDGLEAAVHLQQRGFQPQVTCLGNPDTLPPDARASWHRAMVAGVQFTSQPPERPDLCIDALLGIGSTRGPDGAMAHWIAAMQSCGAPVLAVDTPTGLQGDTGSCAPSCVKADHTLSLLTLKPGLFTAQGRDAAGQVWWDDLGVSDGAVLPLARLGHSDGALSSDFPHASHKGSRGDVAIVGGATGMVGAAFLAASAALHGGAGRVFVSLLDPCDIAFQPMQPELMLRALGDLPEHALTLVCGCGGGDRIPTVLPELLVKPHPLVLDADGLNAIANDPALRRLVRQRGDPLRTVLTPHPLEAARLLGTNTAHIQADRLASAQALAEQFQCTVVLKGSGTITTAPHTVSVINPTGNGRLATGGTGDVLAGMIGARLAGGMAAFDAAAMAVFQHGLIADQWPPHMALTAGALASAVR
jgi:hydroxyethylthiazole kinase-like uncharacterized protein yjeF